MPVWQHPWENFFLYQDESTYAPINKNNEFFMVLLSNGMMKLAKLKEAWHSRSFGHFSC